MPLTPNYDLPYPTLSSVADVPSDIEALAEEVDTQLGTLSTAISGKASTSHNHDVYATGYRAVGTGTGSVTSSGSPSARTAAATVTWTAGRRYLVLFKGTMDNSSGTDTGCGANIELLINDAVAQTAAAWVTGNASSEAVYVSGWFISTGSGSKDMDMRIDRTSANGIARLSSAQWTLIDIGDV